jgi:Tfp pilus assembly protein PilN
MEVGWGSPPPPESIQALRERFGNGNVLAVALDMSVVFAKRLELPPLSMEERRRILSLDPRRYFPVRDQALVAGVRDDDLVVAVSQETFDQWVDALGALGSVERVEPVPAALTRQLVAHGVGEALVVLQDSGGAGATLATVAEGRLQGLRKVHAGAGELPGLVVPVLGDSGTCVVYPRDEALASELAGHMREGGEVEGVPAPPGAPALFAAAHGALLGLEGGQDLTLLSQGMERRLAVSRRRRLAQGVAAVVAALGLLGWSLDHRREATLQALEREVAQAEAAAEPVLEQRAEAAALAEDLDQLMRAAEARPNPLEVLLAVTRVLPQDAYLTRLSASGEDWELNGRARDAARLISLLEGSAVLTDVRFRTATTRVRVGGEELENFTVVFRHVPAT